jgi:hypothetical protein
VIATLGAAGDSRFSDFDHDGGVLYGSGALDVFGCCGQLFSMDSTAQATWISSDTLGYGLNPYDTTGSADPIARGGFAVHPSTGDFWGIEALRSQAPVVYRIDPTSGLADSILRLGIGGVEAPQQIGFDGLHILDDGTFVATRGGVFTSEDSMVWEIGSVPDPVSGLAEIAPIALTLDTLVVGGLNGLSRLPSLQDSTLTLSLTADTTKLHPWIRRTTFVADDTLFEQDSIRSDTASLTIATMFSGQVPAADQEILLSARFLPGTGGHVHIEDTLYLDSASVVGTEAEGFAWGMIGRPLWGFFRKDTTGLVAVTDTTDAQGVSTVKFAAGFVGGEVAIIASTIWDSVTVADTLVIRITSGPFEDLEDNSTITANVALVGGTVDTVPNPNLTLHPQDSIWHATAMFEDSVVALADQMQNGSMYLQYNDASLPYGGAFTVSPVADATGARVEYPWAGHRSHALGVDLDVSACWAATPGDNGQLNRVSYDPEIEGCPGGADVDRETIEETARDYGLRAIVEGNHFHLRPRSFLEFVCLWDSEEEKCVGS